jgi:hypothetical protein
MFPHWSEVFSDFERSVSFPSEAFFHSERSEESERPLSKLSAWTEGNNSGKKPIIVCANQHGCCKCDF